MTKKNKDLYGFLKNKLDFIKSFFTTVLISLFGLVGFETANFTKNSVLMNILSILAIMLLLVTFIILVLEISKTFKTMKGLLL
ncbi:MAG: hypothetical protein LBP54_04630 [Campylobacteraceae bacterium]|jgi:hypothetical protein|nr:hypothetical protein [Campylobacteraceae bacterium]